MMWFSPQHSYGSELTPTAGYSDSNMSPLSYDECVPSSRNRALSATGNSPDSGYETNSPLPSCPYAEPSPYCIQDLGIEICSQSNGAPFLEIEEQPESSYRFRYLKESQKPHGPLKGALSVDKSPKHSHGPKVKLHNFHGEAIIRIWLFDGNIENGPSPHRLMSTVRNVIQDEPHDIHVDAGNDFTACFDRLNIVHVVTSEDEYQKCYLRKKACLVHNFGDKLIRACPPISGDFNPKEIKAEFKTKDKDICALYFEAFEKRGNEYYFIANAISRPIKNKKSPKTNDLRILRSSHAEGSAAGGDTVFIFTEKIIKSIQVIFTDDDGWIQEAFFNPDRDIHKQVAVAFITPPYKNINITKPVVVEYYITRTTDKEKSEPLKFRYLPIRSDNLEINQPKRKKPRDNTSPDVLPTTSGALRTKQEPHCVMDEDPSSEEPPSCVDLNTLLDRRDSQTADGLEEVRSSDLLYDNLWGNYLDDYNLDWDSSPQTPGVPSSSKSLGRSTALVFEKARRLHASIFHDNMNEFINYLGKDTCNYKINSKTPLHLAVQHERTAMVDKLLASNADPYALDGIGSNTPLHIAILSSPLSLQVLMSSTLPPLYVFNKDGDDPLLFSIRHGKINALKLLLKKGFTVRTSNVKDGEGPLHIAFQIKDESIRYETVRLLLKHGASTLIKNGAGLTALDDARAQNQPVELIDILTERFEDENGPEDSEDDDINKDDELSKALGLMHLKETDKLAGQYREEIDEFKKHSAPVEEPYLALDGDVETSKKVAELTQCAFLKSILASAQKQSQVLLRQLERKMSPEQAVKVLNEAYAQAKGQ